jgi:hypothetical protein
MSKFVKQVNGKVTNTHTGRTYTAAQWAKKQAKRDARATLRGEILPPVKCIVAGKVKVIKDVTAPAQAKRLAKTSPKVKALTAAERKAQRQHLRRSEAAKASWAKRKAAAASKHSVEYIDHEGNVLAASAIPAKARR